MSKVEEINAWANVLSALGQGGHESSNANYIVLKEITVIVKWTRVTDINRMYRLYREIYKDTGFLCTKCSAVVRKVHKKVVEYYNAYYKNV